MTLRHYRIAGLPHRLPASALVMLLTAAGGALSEPYHLVDNFSIPLPSTAELNCQVDWEHARVGLAAARIAYRMDPGRKAATVSFPDLARPVGGPGMARLWVEGDASGIELEIVLRHARVKVESDGRRSLVEHGNLVLPRIRLDFDDWREITLDARAIPQDRTAWWQALTLHAAKTDKPKLEGVLRLDDFRLTPTSTPPESAFSTGLIGPGVRDFSRDLAFFLDVRNFLAKPAVVQVRVSMTDRNENRVADRDFRVDFAAGETKEVRLDLAPENLEAYLPPFRISGDVLSGELSKVSAQIDVTLVMGNGLMLFEDFSNLHGRWMTSGYTARIRNAYHDWLGWTHGEAQRASPWAQTSARISRVELPASDNTAAAATPVPGPYALQLDYTGDSAIYSSLDRYLPGNAFRLGVWVKGNGSSDTLSALILDYTDSGDFWVGGWRRVWNGERTLCTLNFQDWRYFEVDLPGNGVGTNAPKGSSDGLDFPLELTAFRIQTAGEKSAGSVWIGPIFAHTQIAASSTLSVHLGYGDPNHAYAPGKKAWITVHNGARTGLRKVNLSWSFEDRGGEALAGGQAELDLRANERHVVPVDFAPEAEAIAARLGPLRLQATASDAADVSASATRQILLAKPDSLVRLNGFEADRGYLGLKADGIMNAPPYGTPAAFTSRDQAHGGLRSLALPWDKAQRKATFVSIDPPIPGVPVEISLWVHGDGSGVLFYPLIGDRRGAPHGLGTRQWDLFVPRTLEGPLQNAVRVDWQGWRELRFHLPQIPPGWDRPLPILAWSPSYPLGVHLAVLAEEASAEKGCLYVDDVAVSTHLPPEERWCLTLDRAGEANVVAPGSNVQVRLANQDAAEARKARLTGAVTDWRGRAVHALDAQAEIPAGQEAEFTLARELLPGAYAVRAELRAGDRVLASLEEDLIVAPLEPWMGKEWAESLRDEWKLRGPIRDRFAFVDEDWDWVEHHPGNLQIDTIRNRSKAVWERGALPYVLLGYSAYWAAGAGFDQMKAGAFVRRQRDIGHAVDIFLIPERIDDWENYVREVMRAAGREVGGWVLWNNPDGSSSLAVQPDRFAAMVRSAGQWRQVYCPETPLILGGLGRETAVAYLARLAEHHALESITGIHVRMDVGRLSPEDARVPAYVQELQAALQGHGGTPKTILLTDLDWAVEKDPKGLNAFDQAAYLVRSDLLLHRLGIRPALSIRNEDDTRLGLSLAYRQERTIPPLSEKILTYQLKPAWWGITLTRRWLDQLRSVAEIEVQDVVPGRTRCLLYERKEDGKSVAIAWRNDDEGHLSFDSTGLKIEAAEDLFGTPVASQDGWYPVGKLPVVFVLGKSDEPAAQGLARLWVRDADAPAWPQRVLAAFTPDTGQRVQYEQSGGQPAAGRDRTVQGESVDWGGLRFPAGGRETFQVAAAPGCALVLRKRFLLDDTGHEAEVRVNGRLAGRWNLKKTDPKLSGGLRDALFVVEEKALAGSGRAALEIRTAGPAVTAGWQVLEYRGGDFPLSAVGAIHGDQNVQHPRWARNVIGNPLQVGVSPHANGIGVFARSLLEYALNGQFRRFSARAGIDAATEGKGSVVFEVYGDGKKLWSSGIVTGLDAARDVEVDLTGVDRLRLVVTDAGDGNKFDAADWCDPVLER
ncbi:MAG: NPCBM/NEW2 domain-containing protein [Planctomycetes bacterium]|nr:NPCBM/NEW2 domain-containing protein [Planctomycetota bacterium]